MNVASGYSVVGNYGNYGTEKTLPANSKPFIIPIEELMGEKTTQKTESNSNTNNYVKGPFNNLFKAGTFNFQDYCAKIDPTFDVGMYTKTEPKRSDEEILREIEELAKEHAKTGQFQSDDKRFLELMDEYVSSASPDREGILNHSMNEIFGRLYQCDYSMNSAFQQMDLQRKHKEEEKEPVDYFLEALKNKGKVKGSNGTISGITKNGNYYTVNLDHGGGMQTILNYDSSGKFVSMQMQGNNYYVGGIDNYGGTVTNAQFYDDNGEEIAYYSQQSGFHSEITNKELLRRKELTATYNAAFDVAIGRHQEEIKPASNDAFEKEYLDVLNNTYNKVYERLKNSSVA